MPNYTDPHLLPYPLTEEYGQGAQDVEELARAVDPLLAAQDARITALATRPTLIVRRSADVAFSPGDPIAYNTVDHNNASVVIGNNGNDDTYTTPQPGAHAVAGVYPAIWRFDLCNYFTAGAPVAGQDYTSRCFVFAYDPSEGAQDTYRVFEVSEVEANAGAVAGVYMSLSGCVYLPSPGTFIPDLSGIVVTGTFKANSFFSLTRIRSV